MRKATWPCTSSISTAYFSGHRAFQFSICMNFYMRDPMKQTCAVEHSRVRLTPVVVCSLPYYTWTFDPHDTSCITVATTWRRNVTHLSKSSCKLDCSSNVKEIYWCFWQHQRINISRSILQDPIRQMSNDFILLPAVSCAISYRRATNTSLLPRSAMPMKPIIR